MIPRQQPCSPLGLVRLTMVIAGTLATSGVASAQASFEVLHTFTGADGAVPSGALIQAADGNFYGTTQFGGSSNLGTIYKMTPDGALTSLYSFAGDSDGAVPVTALIQAASGNFYGTTSHGGGPECSALALSGCGTVFGMTPDGSVTVLHSFSDGHPIAGAFPRALIQGADGNLYGTTLWGGGSGCGGSGCGTAFKITPDGDFTIVHTFSGADDDSNPASALIQATDGNLWGTTVSQVRGGSTTGVVFSMTPDGTVSVIYNFTGVTGFPYGPILQGSDGILYGAAIAGDGPNVGRVFSVTLDGGTFTTLHRFNGTDGGDPNYLIQAADSQFYGTTPFGGGGGGPCFDGCGTVFQLTSDGILTVLHAFTGSADGRLPTAVIQATDGSFYGTAQASGPGTGVVFRVKLP